MKTTTTTKQLKLIRMINVKKIDIFLRYIAGNKKIRKLNK